MGEQAYKEGEKASLNKTNSKWSLLAFSISGGFWEDDGQLPLRDVLTSFPSDWGGALWWLITTVWLYDFNCSTLESSDMLKTRLEVMTYPSWVKKLIVTHSELFKNNTFNTASTIMITTNIEHCKKLKEKQNGKHTTHQQPNINNI